MTDLIARRFKQAVPSGLQFCSMRYVDEKSESLTLRRGILQPVQEQSDTGIMITVHHNGGLGYAATSDVSSSGIEWAIARAKRWAERTAALSLIDTSSTEMTHPVGSYETPVERPWVSVPISEKIEILKQVDAGLPIDPRIVDWSCSLLSVRTKSLYITSDGGRVEQSFEMMAPDLNAVANEGTETQRRSFGSRGVSQQGGMEVLDRVGFSNASNSIAREALQLLEAPNCPTGKMDLLLSADQMMLQIHESIGHPLELDRILGDERNYAGTSFVTLDMFGKYRYGSERLNVTFDPTIRREFASYRYDDHGSVADKEFIIKDGLLVRPLGGAISQARAGTNGVANSRASSWNRPPIDRMANLNVEPGDKSFDELIANIEKGVLMRTNTSWSIDDSRNKFQFGCEFGEYIEDGTVRHVVKNPNYRGISATFWRNLNAVGNVSTFEVLGTPYCGKGEPNQVIRVGHASPACVFGDVEIFGGG